MSAHAPSYYAATAKPFPAQPRLVGDINADVVVVGGGFTGLSAALHCAEAGYSVVLLEAGQIGCAASGRNGGQLIPGLRWGAVELAERFGEDTARQLLVIANSAGDLVRERIARHAIACDLRQGHFHAAVKPAHLDDMRRELAMLERLTAIEEPRSSNAAGFAIRLPGATIWAACSMPTAGISIRSTMRSGWRGRRWPPESGFSNTAL